MSVRDGDTRHYYGCWRDHPKCAQAIVQRLADKYRGGIDLPYYAMDSEEISAEMFYELEELDRVLTEEGIS